MAAATAAVTAWQAEAAVTAWQRCLRPAGKARAAQRRLLAAHGHARRAAHRLCPEVLMVVTLWCSIRYRSHACTTCGQLAGRKHQATLMREGTAATRAPPVGQKVQRAGHESGEKHTMRRGLGSIAAAQNFYLRRAGNVRLVPDTYLPRRAFVFRCHIRLQLALLLAAGPQVQVFEASVHTNLPPAGQGQKRKSRQELRLSNEVSEMCVLGLGEGRVQGGRGGSHAVGRHHQDAPRQLALSCRRPAHTYACMATR